MDCTKLLHRLLWLHLLLITLVRADFPMDNPRLLTCDDGNDDITASILQKCINLCMEVNHCCGNRLNGEAPHTAAELLSCANGCEFAFHRSTVAECKADCQEGNQRGCEYRHPIINRPFEKCGLCQESCNKWPDKIACSDGCDFAANLPEFYQYKEPVDNQADVPRFLFAGQSNMEGWSEQALPGSFRRIIKILHRKFPERKTKNKIRKLLDTADAAESHTSRNEARLIYEMRSHLKKNAMFKKHRKTTCSFTMPSSMTSLDCERPLSSTACGGGHSQYGPEFMFGHVFPKQDSPLKWRKISITKVAVGGTRIYQNWMVDNKDADDNYWYSLVDAIKAANGSLEAFVWFQGESDAFQEDDNKNYLQNLTKFVADVRQEIFDTSGTKFATKEDIPVVIVELGYWIYGLWDDIGKSVIEAQNTFVQNDPNAIIVKSGAGSEQENLTAFYHYDAASILIVGLRIAKAMANILKQNADRRL